MNVVYRYGLLAPTRGAVLVAEQMRKAHDYRNQLIELERSRRQQIRKAESELVQQQLQRLERANATVAELVSEVKRERMRTKKRSEGDELKLRLKAAKEEQKVASKAWREARAAIKEHQQKVIDEANERFLEGRKLLRPGTSKQKGMPADQKMVALGFGTYQLVEDAVTRSAKMPLWDRGEPQDPRFQRWTGEGFVSVQIVNGAPVDEITTGQSTQVNVIDVHEVVRATDHRNPESKRSKKNRRMLLQIRVGSDETKKPIWACFPMLLHRPFPEGAVVKRASVFLRKIGPRDEWCAQFVLQIRDPEPTANKRVVAIDLGWRQRRDGTLRIGYMFDSEGHSEELLLPPNIRSGLDKADSLRSTRDLNFGTAKAELCAWMKVKSISFGDVGKDIAQWRSPNRLAGLVLAWKKRRFDGDEEMFLKMEAWRKQDLHLWAWESSQRTGMLRCRKDFFRCLAKGLAREYGTLVLEDFDLRSVQRRSGKHENETSRSNRVVASPSELRQVLSNAFCREGGTVVTVDAKHTTRTCSVCGSVEEFDQATMLLHECKNGHEWDQDENAAKNILDRWRTMEPKPTAAADSETRLERIRRRRQDKIARMASNEKAETA